MQFGCQSQVINFPTFLCNTQSPMPRCPQCAKKLKSHMAVLAHMNQPLGSCISYVAEIATLPQTSPSPEVAESLVTDEMQGDAFHFQSLGVGDLIEEADPETMAFDEGPIPASGDHITAATSRTTSEQVIKEYPVACLTFGKGKTFLEDFNTDSYAEQQEVNLYYPF